MRVTLQTHDGKKIEYEANYKSLQPLPAIPCLRCGNCCTKWQPPVTKDEIETIARKLGIPKDKFFAEYIQEYPLKPKTYLLRRQNNACVFLKFENDKANCLIHPFKPIACRNWTPSLLRNECQEGLRRRQKDDLLLLPSDLPLSPEEKANFYSFGFKIIARAIIS